MHYILLSIARSVLLGEKVVLAAGAGADRGKRGGATAKEGGGRRCTELTVLKGDG
jgi:hypothetical protein